MYFISIKKQLNLELLKNQLIDKTNTGKYFTYEKSDIKQDILELFTMTSKFKFLSIDQFSRKELTKSLSELLNSL